MDGLFEYIRIPFTGLLSVVASIFISFESLLQSVQLIAALLAIVVAILTIVLTWIKICKIKENDK